MTIIPSIDYFSYSFESPPPTLLGPRLGSGLNAAAADELVRLVGASSLDDGEFRPVVPMKPFRHAFQHIESKMYVAYSPEQGRGVVQFPGQGCDFLEQRNSLFSTLGRKGQRATRLDIAVDILTATHPEEFIEQRTNRRMKRETVERSEDGFTTYVGSKQSDRYARVYRYLPPHERADWLRVEMVFKAHEAKAVVQDCIVRPLPAVAASAGTIYGWAHPDWDTASLTGTQPVPMPSMPKERHPSRTLRWLEEVAIPAAIRLYDTGEIDDLYAWFNQQVSHQLTKDRERLH